MSSSDHDDDSNNMKKVPPGGGRRGDEPRFRSAKTNDYDDANEHEPAKYRLARMQKQPPPQQEPVWRCAPMVDRPSSLIGVAGGGVDRNTGGARGAALSPQRPKALHVPSDDIRKKDFNEGITGDIRKDFNDGITGKTEPDKGRTKERPSNWFVKEGSLKQVPTYYPLEKSSRYVTGTSVGVIASKISDACRVMSVHAEYDLNEDVPGTAYLRTSEHVEIQLQLWQGTPPRHPDCVIVEAQRRRGDAVTFHKYARNLLDAADGAFSTNTYISLEDQEAEYCRKAEEVLAHGKKPMASGTVIENALLALEIAASLLKKDRMDARQLGMESLCLLTDPTRTGVETALIASRVVLTGSAQDESTDDDDYEANEWGIREAILALVQFGRLGDDGAFEQDSYSDNDSDAQGHPDEQRHNEMLHNLALAVLANALDVLENHGRRLCEIGSESPSSVADSFLSESEQMAGKDLMKTLLSKLRSAEAKPHDATLSAKCLGSLCGASRDARRRAKELKAKQIVQTALEVGERTNVKLEKESQKVITTLTKMEDDPEHPPQE